MRKWQTIKEYEDIKFDFFEGIAKITINRPRVYNAFRPQTNKEMLDAMTICRERNDIGVVVLTGAGDKAFCSGSSEDANVCSCDGRNHSLLSIEYLDGREVSTPFQPLQRADTDSC